MVVDSLQGACVFSPPLPLVTSSHRRTLVGAIPLQVSAPCPKYDPEIQGVRTLYVFLHFAVTLTCGSVVLMFAGEFETVQRGVLALLVIASFV